MFAPSNGFGDPVAFLAIFFEEVQEHLANVEAILLRLDLDAPQPDDLNAIFRAVHSIKGSASMLGCPEMAALTHLQENLLDLLRKGERPMDAADVEAMLQAGDVLRSQVQHRRGALAEAPDASAVEALLRERVAQPLAGARAGQDGPPTRRFRVQLGPLAQPIDDLQLQMTLTGLSEMGTVSQASVDNRAGGSVRFEVVLQGAAADLHSVLALVVAPEQIHIETLGVVATGCGEAGLPQPGGDEVFVDPAELRSKRAQAGDPRPADFAAHEHPADACVDLFLSPEEFQSRRALRAAAQPAAAPPAQAPAHHDGGEALAAPHETAYIRVATEKVDLLVNLVGELVITEAMLARTGALGQEPGDGRYAPHSGLADLARHTRNLQDAVLAIRMLPISKVFQRLPRLVHELSARLGKRVELKMSGEATELDRGLIEKIADPLTHLVRNAIDHGLETPQARLAAGKPPTGVLTLRASQRGGHVVIEVGDDGRGLDRARILARAQECGLAVSADPPDSEVFQLVFEPGLSTADEVTDISGRGVGMDVVKQNIRALNGTVELASAPGQGTRVTVSVPLTLAIMEAMTIAIGGETYVLPLAGVVESLSVVPKDLHTLPGQRAALRVRDEYLPVLHLASLFPPRKPREQGGDIAVIVEADGSKLALIVDELVGQQQVVVKSLEANFRKVPGLAGATVMGDGSVGLILDVAHLVRLSGHEGALRF